MYLRFSSNFLYEIINLLKLDLVLFYTLHNFVMSGTWLTDGFR